MIVLKNKSFLGYWRQPLFYSLLGINILLFSSWFSCKLYHTQAQAIVQRLESFHQEHRQQQRLLHVLKKGTKDLAPLLAPPLTSEHLKKEVKKVAKQHAMELQEPTTTPQPLPPLPHLLQLALTSTALLEADCFAFIAALQQVPGFLGFKEVRLKRNYEFSHTESFASPQPEPGAFAPFNLQLTLLWGVNPGGSKL
jgi:hypothetical protein